VKLAGGVAVESLGFPETVEEFAMHPTQLRPPPTHPLASAATALVATAVVATAFAGAALAGADKPAPPQNVTIPFADRHGIEDWQADGDRGLWIQSRDRKWYYARFFAPCFGLAFHEALRFKFGPAGELDRWSEVFTRDSGRCAFTSLVASDGPPRKPKHAAPAASTAPTAAAPPPGPSGPPAPPPPLPAPGG
jgi:hypothetical protein